MSSQDVPGFGALRRRCRLGALAAALAIMAGGWPGFSGSLASAQSSPPGVSPFEPTLNYLVLFYPLWFTYYQSTHAPANRLVGPDRMAPLFREVVAPTDDTLSVNAFTDLSGPPLILTVPATNVTWSLLTTDYYGRVFDTHIPEGVAGTYALTRPGWTGRLPAGVTRISVPFPFSVWIFRADRFSPTHQEQTAQAELFRSSLRLATLAEYRQDPTAGRAATFPVALFSTAFKVLADELIAKDAITFLQQLQTAVHSPQTPPLSPFERQVSNRFDRLFGNGVLPPNSGANIVKRAAFITGAQAAHALIVDSYLSHTGRTNWVTYPEIGAWGDDLPAWLARCATTQYLQLSNPHSTVASYQVFKDGTGAPLNGNKPGGYVLTFPGGSIPPPTRFWSLTAYTLESITLVENTANKYAVASYTPGLQTNPDGSLSISIAADLPPGVPEANWLPVPRGAFNVVLRFYGPTGSVAENTYLPPALQ
jgi:hypothetical protein